jgi:hypothetical protein
MSSQTPFAEPARVNEPQGAEEYSLVLTQVAAQGRAVIVRRNGEDLAAVIPLEHLELLREVLARQEVEKKAARLDFEQLVTTRRPPQAWFGDDDNPSAPEGGTSP